MKNLYDIIEGILDDEDDLVDDNKFYAKKWVEDNCTGRFNIMYLKDGTLKLSSGKLVIKNYKEKTIPADIVFSAINGSIVIEKCPKLTSLNGMIKEPEFMTMKGSLSIGNCPKFNTLEGLPHIIDGDFTLIGNPSLKSLEFAPEMVFGSISLMKNGKRFKEDVVNSYIKYSRRIDCSFEESDEILESVVNEALNEPHLLKLAKTLRDNGLSFANYVTVPQGYYAYDEVDASNVEVYNMVDKKQKSYAITDIRNICSDRLTGMAIGVKNNQYKCVLFRGKQFLWIESYGRVQEEPTTYIVQSFEGCDEIIIIELGNELRSYQKHGDRVKSREGMIRPGDESQYRDIARANIRRYKEIIAQNKMNKDKTYEEITNLVNKALQSYLKAATLLHKDPVKYADSIYSLQVAGDYINGRASYDRGKTYGKNGIMYFYEHYNRSYAQMHKQSTAFGVDKDYYYKNLKSCETQIRELCKKFENYLKQAGLDK